MIRFTRSYRGAMVSNITRTACTFSSSKWPGRAPGDGALVRVYLGRADDPLETGIAGEDLVRRARAGLEAATGWRGASLFSMLHRADDALPQYDVGHLDRVEELERALESLPGVAVAGADYRGVGLADCAAQGRASASSEGSLRRNRTSISRMSIVSTVASSPCTAAWRLSTFL